MVDNAPLLQWETDHLEVWEDGDGNIVIHHGEGVKQIVLKVVADKRGMHIVVKSGRWKATSLVGKGKGIILVRPPRQRRKKTKRK